MSKLVAKEGGSFCLDVKSGSYGGAVGCRGPGGQLPLMLSAQY